MARNIFLAGVCLLALQAVFVPWKHVLKEGDRLVEHQAGYRPIFSAPEPRLYWGVQVDLATASIPIGAVGLATIAAAVAMRRGAVPEPASRSSSSLPASSPPPGSA